MEFLLKIVLELSVLWGLAILYYMYQKRKIPHYIFEERNQIIDQLLQLTEQALNDEKLEQNEKNIILKLSDHLVGQKGQGKIGITQEFHRELLERLNKDHDLYNYLSSLEAEINEEKQLHH
jgi:hypothetical protein